MNITATELKTRLGQYLDTAETEAVIIKKSGRAKSVLISHAKYEYFSALEDRYWAEKALEAEKEGYLNEDKTRELLSLAPDV